MTLGRMKTVDKVLLYLAVASACLLIGFPVYWMLITSLQDQARLLTLPPAFLAVPPRVEGYAAVVKEFPIWTWMVNSLVVALASTAFSVLFSILSGYSLSRFKYAGNGIFGLLILVTQMLPATLIIIPLYIMFAGLKLLDTFWGLIIANSTFSLPLCTWTLKGFFDSLPKELEEAAVVDGCNTLGVLFKVMLPLAAPAVVAVAVISFFAAWDEYMFANTFISDPAKWVGTMGLAAFKGEMYTPWDRVMAGAFIFTLPAIVFFLVLQRYIVSGLTVGAVKG
ncbi:MAG: carbohydrate ABC transporter permease [Bacillota bacterium]|jgi:multiple sugar transport system permease protein